MSFVKSVMEAIRYGSSSSFIDVANRDSGDDLTNPDALAFYHTKAKFTKEQGQRVAFPRASSLYDACMRMHVIATRSGKEFYSTDTISPQSVLIFEVGNAIHYMVQNTPCFFGSRRIGWWECLSCGNLLYFGKPPTAKCPKCGARPEAIFYKEHGFEPTAPYYCSGHVDMFLEVAGGLPRLLDVKSMGEDEFYSLEAVRAKDECQLITYMMLAEKGGGIPKKIDSERGFIFYICKRTKANGIPYKMFHVVRNEYNTNATKRRLDVFREGYEKFPKALPPIQSGCEGFTSYQAKNCPCVQECINLSRRGER